MPPTPLYYDLMLHHHCNADEKGQLQVFDLQSHGLMEKNPLVFLSDHLRGFSDARAWVLLVSFPLGPSVHPLVSEEGVELEEYHREVTESSFCCLFSFSDYQNKLCKERFLHFPSSQTLAIVSFAASTSAKDYKAMKYMIHCSL